MLKRVFVALISLILLCSFSIYKSHAQDQMPLVPPLDLYGTAYVDGSPLTGADTGYTVSMRMARLVLIFLDDPGSQGLITAMIGELDAGTITALQQAFVDSQYCDDRGILLSPAAVVTVETPGAEWLVTGGGNVYTAIIAPILLWDGGWVAGYRLEVYQHNGEIASYDMGSDPQVGNYYAVQIPMSSDEVYGGLPPNDTYLMRDPGKAVQDNDDAYIYINDIPIIDPILPYVPGSEGFMEMDIYAPSTQIFVINLVTGRNLISFPLQPQDTARDVILATILDKILSVWRYDSVLGWRWYFPSDPGGSNFGNVMEAGVGYWFEMAEPASLTIIGSVPPTIIPLSEGRNLVGCNIQESKSITDAMASIDQKYVSAWVLDQVLGWRWYFAADPGGSNLWNLEPGMGIWVNTTESCDWDIDP